MAYVTATIRVNELQAEGTARLIVEFSGDAGEPAKSRPFLVAGPATMPQLREWVFAQLADLNTSRTVITAPAVQVGQVIAPLTPPGPPALTAEQTWQRNAQRLVRATALGLTAAAAVADLATVRTTVNTTYVAGYLGRF